MSRLLILCGLIMGVTVSSAVAQNPAPPGPPPQFGIVASVDAKAGRFEVRYSVMMPVTETYEFEEVIDGRRETRQGTRLRHVLEVRARSVALEDARVVTAGKKVLDEEAALEQLKPDTAVLLHQGGSKLDPRYLKMLREDVLIVVLKASPTPQLPMPRAAPALKAIPSPAP